tara:strand:+ start:117 stop:527 length:411 start_codon:yes stop_codon:yes gene_type:complete
MYAARTAVHDPTDPRSLSGIEQSSGPINVHLAVGGSATGRAVGGRNVINDLYILTSGLQRFSVGKISAHHLNARIAKSSTPVQTSRTRQRAHALTGANEVMRQHASSETSRTRDQYPHGADAPPTAGPVTPAGPSW